MRIRTQLVIALVLSAGLSSPLMAQRESNFWENKWFWGAQAGGYAFSAGGSQEFAASVGGHWFITAGRSALYLAFDQIIATGSQVILQNGVAVDFSQMQRIQATIYAMPQISDLQIYLGGGFAIHHVTDAGPVGSFATPQALSSAEQQIEELATKAFAVLSGGMQYRWRDRWVVFGQYQFMPSSNDFLVTSPQHALNGGMRFALTGSKEQVSTER